MREQRSFIGGSAVPTADRVQPEHAPDGFYALIGKRLLDLSAAIVLLPLLAPVIGAVWAMIRMDGGPGFYSQKRLGRNGRIFNCWKIRTMCMDAEAVLRDLCEADPEVAREWHENQKLANDPRVTRVGAFLRATSLDELPQIWNILTGDMSFIGPRPMMTSQEAMYRSTGATAYFQMRPGLSGPWQVEGRGKTSFSSRVSYDEAYFRQLTFANDMRLVWKTVQILLLRTGQ